METLNIHQSQENKNYEHSHNFAMRVNRIVHDERFWPAVFAATLIVLFVGLVIWAGIYGESHPATAPAYPYTPYIY